MIDTERQALPGGSQVFGNIVIGGYSLGAMLAQGVLEKWDKSAALGGVFLAAGYKVYDSTSEYNSSNYAVIKQTPLIVWHGNQDSVFNYDTRKTDFNDNLKGIIYSGSEANCKMVSQYGAGHGLSPSTNLMIQFFADPTMVTSLTSNFLTAESGGKSGGTDTKKDGTWDKDADGAQFLKIGGTMAMISIV